MRREETFGGWYGDNLFTGDYVSLLAGHSIKLNNQLTIALPNGEDTLYLKMYLFNNEILLAGKGGRTGSCYIKQLGERDWINLGPVNGDVNPIVFNGPYLFICRNNFRVDRYNLIDLSLSFVLTQAIGVNGIRYFDENSTPHTGDETYNGSLDPSINVAQYTRLFHPSLPIIVGQGYNGGLIAVTSHGRFQIEPGAVNFYQAYRQGNNFCVTCVKQLENKTVFLWFDYDELIKFPPEGHIKPDEPEEPKVIPNHLDIVTSERSKFGSKIGDKESFTITNRVVERIASEGWGLCKAPSGGHGFVVDGQNYRVDKIVLKNTSVLVDILGSSGTGASTPVWNVNENDPNALTSWAHFVSNIPDDNGNTDPNPPVPNNSELQSLKNLVLKLQGDLESLRSAAIMRGDRIALKTGHEWNGVEKEYYLCAEQMGSPEDSLAQDIRTPGAVNASRKSVGAFESWTVEKLS
jgi:hypothetical protein